MNRKRQKKQIMRNPFSGISTVYKKYQKGINLVFLLILIVFPLVRSNQGLSVVDTTYSLSNFEFFGQMDGTWMVATFLANVLGSLILHLPGGAGVLGFNLYAGLLISGMAVFTALWFRKWIPLPVCFLAEMLAIALCWCPVTILYNILTYVLLAAGTLLLLSGILAEQKAERYLFAAGVCLGLNVMVRMPNLSEAALIVVLWYSCYLLGVGFGKALQKTGVCLAGYLTGFGIPFVAICVRYGFSAWPDMVKTMFAMTDTAKDYQASAMLSGVMGHYLMAISWAVLLLCALIPGGVVEILWRALCKNERISAESPLATFVDKIRKPASVLGTVGATLVVIRICWGRGMFNYRYCNYGSVYTWGVLFCWLALITAVAMLFHRVTFFGRQEAKILAATVLVLLFVVPLGSNNGLYPMVGNLFVVAPVTFCFWYIWLGQHKNSFFAFKTLMACLLVFLLIQGTLFHIEFALQDGVWGEGRTAAVITSSERGHRKTAGMMTTQKNADSLGAIMDFVEEQSLAGTETIFYGETPGLGYFLDLPSALSTFWPDLASYRMSEFDRDLELVREKITETGEKPLVLVSIQTAAWIDGDAEAIQYWIPDDTEFERDQKLAIIKDFTKEYSYEQIFCDGVYAIYQAK